MKISLKGLIESAADALEAKKKDPNARMYAFCLKELLGHIQATVDGKHTLEEFADFYCVKKAVPKQEATSDV